MEVIFTPRYNFEIGKIAKFIAFDSKVRANAFIDGVERACFSLVDMPYKCRKSIHFDDENVRDLIYKGYVVPYSIENGVILILGIYKENSWESGF